MLGILLSHGVSANKATAKDGSILLGVEQSQFAQAVSMLSERGYPRHRFETMGDVFKSSGLAASPMQERARFLWALSQELSATVAEIDGNHSRCSWLPLPRLPAWSAQRVGWAAGASPPCSAPRRSPCWRLQRFRGLLNERLPVAARADRLAAAIGDGVSAELAGRLLATPAIRKRILALLDRRFGPLVRDAALGRLLAMNSAAVARLASEIGSVWHGRALLRLLGGKILRALTDAFGFDPRLAALRFALLAPPAAATPDHALAGCIEGDGAACLAAWCASLAAPARVRAELCLPFHASPDEAHVAHGPVVAAAVLGGLHDA